MHVILLGMKDLQFRIRKFAARYTDVYLAGPDAGIDSAGNHVSHTNVILGFDRRNREIIAGSRPAANEGRAAIRTTPCCLVASARVSTTTQIEFVENALKDRKKFDGRPG